MRRVHLAGVTLQPNGFFMGEAAEWATRFLRGKRFVICDRDTKFSVRFRIVLEAAGIRPIRTPRQAPNANAYAERFVRSIKEECLRRMIFFGEARLRHAIGEYLAHYHGERNHQGLGNELIDGRVQSHDGEVVRPERLGGLLSFYERAA
jgi:transposase InsO family protein